MTFAVHAMSSASPDLTDDTMTALRESIASIGQLVPIVMWRGEVIDGRKRLACCEALGIEPQTVTLGDEVDALDHAGALNLLRTHYTISQRAMYASRLATLQRGEVGQHRPRGDAGIPGSPIIPTVKEAAAMVGVHHTSVATAKRVRRIAAPELVDAVERGDLTLDAAEKIAERVPLAEQPSIAARVCSEKVGKRNMPAKVLGLAKPRIAKAKPIAEVLTRLFDELENGTRILSDHLDAPLPDVATQEDWAASLDRILPPLRRMRRRLMQGGRDE